jgi:hypothetical protein
VVIRPPAAHAHYHSEEGERLLDSLLERVAGRPDLSVVILPRTKEQGEEIRRRAAELRLEAVIPNKPLHGLNLVVHADLVVSGGGTMNREAIALGAPVYSIFKGALGSLDRMFIASGKMQHIGSPEELGRIRFEKRASGAVDAEAGPRLIQFIVGELLATAAPAGAKHPAMRPAADPAGGEGSRRFDG